MKKARALLLAAFCMLFLCSCKKTVEETAGQKIEVYYLNKEETKISSEAYALKAQELGRQIEELLWVMAQAPDKAEYKAVISSAITILEAVVEEGQLILTVDEGYRNLESTTEVLTRAALVRTLTQLKGIDHISMKIRETPLTDVSGNPIGPMEAAMFVDNAGDEINAYEKVRLTLYYTEETGTKLVEATKTVVYNTNISMEKLVMEQLIAGPGTAELSATINPETKINSVTVKDGICYVNLNESFLTQTTAATSEVTIYSIVNSLVELPDVNKVQISVNGDTEGTYRESIPFSTIFERNLELLE